MEIKIVSTKHVDPLLLVILDIEAKAYGDKSGSVTVEIDERLEIENEGNMTVEIKDQDTLPVSNLSTTFEQAFAKQFSEFTVKFT